MKTLKTLIGILILLCIKSATNAAEFTLYETSEGIKTEAVKNELLVRFNPGVTNMEKKICFHSYGIDKIKSIPRINIKKIRVPDGQLKKVKRGLKNSRIVDYAGLNTVYHAQQDYRLPGEYNNLEEMEEAQWGLVKTRLPSAWDIETGTDVVIAIIDSGVDMNHETLKENIWINPNEKKNGKDTSGSGYIDDLYGWDFVNDNNDPDDDNNHGTHVAGIAAAAENGVGIVGASWRSRIMSLKVLDSRGSGTESALAEAIIYAADNNAHIINMSLGTSEELEAVNEAAEYARKKETLLIAARGNNNSSGPFYPASYDNIISVAATDPDDDKASFSSYGSEETDLAAPGTDIFSADLNDSYRHANGTSMSSPFVAGIAALAISYMERWNIEWDVDKIKKLLYEACDDINNEALGHGRINASKLMNELDVFKIEAERTFVYSDENTVSLILSEKMHDPSGKEGLFQYRVNNGDPQDFSSIKLHKENSYKFILEKAGEEIQYGDQVKLSYEGGDIQSFSGYRIIPFSEKKVEVIERAYKADISAEAGDKAAGEDTKITIEVKDSEGRTDKTFSGKNALEVSLFNESKSVPKANIGETPINTKTLKINFLFEEGVAIENLTVYSGGKHQITLHLDALKTPAEKIISLTTTHEEEQTEKVKKNGETVCSFTIPPAQIPIYLKIRDLNTRQKEKVNTANKKLNENILTGITPVYSYAVMSREGEEIEDISSVLTEEIKLRLHYQDDVFKSKGDNLIRMVKLDKNHKKWNQINKDKIIINKKEQWVEVKLSDNHICKLVCETPPPLEELYVYPNPLKPSDPAHREAPGGGIVIENLPKNSHVRIFNIAGDLIDDFSNYDSHRINWEKASEISSGVYILVATYRGNTKTQKFSVVK